MTNSRGTSRGISKCIWVVTRMVACENIRGEDWVVWAAPWKAMTVGVVRNRVQGGMAVPVDGERRDGEARATWGPNEESVFANTPGCVC
jgi:hypothetical protein